MQDLDWQTEYFQFDDAAMIETIERSAVAGAGCIFASVQSVPNTEIMFSNKIPSRKERLDIQNAHLYCVRPLLPTLRVETRDDEYAVEP